MLSHLFLMIGLIAAKCAASSSLSTLQNLMQLENCTNFCGTSATGGFDKTCCNTSDACRHGGAPWWQNGKCCLGDWCAGGPGTVNCCDGKAPYCLNEVQGATGMCGECIYDQQCPGGLVCVTSLDSSSTYCQECDPSLSNPQLSNCKTGQVCATNGTCVPAQPSPSPGPSPGKHELDLHFLDHDGNHCHQLQALDNTTSCFTKYWGAHGYQFAMFTTGLCPSQFVTTDENNTICPDNVFAEIRGLNATKKK